jgi:predicted MFS family arabinose efflux permease
VSRDLRLLIGAFGASMIGDRMVAVALAFAVLELGGGVSAIGLVIASGTAGLLLFLTLGGIVADRLPRRRLMVAADLVRLVSQGTVAGLLIAGEAELWMLAAAAAVTGAASGFFTPASTGLMPQVVEDQQLIRAGGYRATAASVGEILGPVLAGVIVAAAGAGWAIAVDALTYAVSAALLLMITVRPGPAKAPARLVADLREGWSAFTAHTWVWVVVAVACGENLIWASFNVLGPVIAQDRLGGAAVWGLVLSVMGAGTLVGALIATRIDPTWPLRIFAFASGSLVVLLAVLASAAPVWVLLVAAGAYGFSVILGEVVWEATLQRQIPADQISRVSSYDWLGSMAGAPIGQVMWGPVALAFGLGATLWTAAGVQLGLIGLLFSVPAVRNLRRGEQGA